MRKQEEKANKKCCDNQKTKDVYKGKKTPALILLLLKRMIICNLKFAMLRKKED